MLRLLKYACDPTNRFENGSIFHDLYTTTYYAYALTKAVKYWRYAEGTVLDIYYDALQQVTTEGRMSVERQQIYEMNRFQYGLQEKVRQLEIQRQRAETEHEQLFKKHKRLWESSLVLLLVYLVVFPRMTWLLPYFGVVTFELSFVPSRIGDFFEFVSMGALVIAALYTLVAVIIFRQD